jgi:hypothetical protein
MSRIPNTVKQYKVPVSVVSKLKSLSIMASSLHEHGMIVNNFSSVQMRKVVSYICYNFTNSFICLETVLRIQDPGSGAFLNPGSGIRNRFFPDPGSENHIFESLVTIFNINIPDPQHCLERGWGRGPDPSRERVSSWTLSLHC